MKMLINWDAKESEHMGTPVNWLSFRNEICRVCQASLLTFSVLLLSCQSARYGCEEHSILENGQFVRGYVYKGVVNIGLGYSNSQALIAAVTALMLLLSLTSRKSNWSLPFIAFYSANLISDLANFIFLLWLLFARVPCMPALFYTSISLIAFLGRLWLWLGTLRLFEQRRCE